MDTISFDSHGTTCAAWYLPGGSDELTNRHGRPCVVMGHGFGATRDSGLLPFAQHFAAAGADVLVFDYRGFGTSDGQRRQDIDHRRHRQDFHAAIAAARSRSGVDASRIAVWGSSYGGGHVVAVAAKDQRVAAVITQGAAMDGLAALRELQSSEGPGKALRMTWAGLRDAAASLARRAPQYLPIVGAPGSPAVISAPGALPGYTAIMGPTFDNRMRARGVLRIATNRPVRVADQVTCPMFVVIAEEDNICPVSAVHRVAERAPRAEVLSIPCGHFDIYTGEIFAKSVAEQTGFLRRVLG